MTTKQIILNYRTENNRWVLGAEPNQEGVEVFKAFIYQLGTDIGKSTVENLCLRMRQEGKEVLAQAVLDHMEGRSE